MIDDPRLYAVVPTRLPQAAPALKVVADNPQRRKRSKEELLKAKNEEFTQKKAIDRASAILDRLESRIAAASAAIAALTKRKKNAEARASRIEDEVLTRMNNAGLERAAGFKVELTTRNSPPKVNILDGAKIPEEYLREKYTVEPDKNAIRDAIIAGDDVPGCELTSKLVLVRK